LPLITFETHSFLFLDKKRPNLKSDSVNNTENTSVKAVALLMTLANQKSSSHYLFYNLIFIFDLIIDIK